MIAFRFGHGCVRDWRVGVGRGGLVIGGRSCVGYGRVCDRVACLRWRQGWLCGVCVRYGRVFGDRVCFGLDIASNRRGRAWLP